MFTVRVESTFSAAHFLSHYQGKCEKLHGHNYRVRAWARGEALGGTGLLLDFGDLKAALSGVLSGLDHRLLNDEPAFAGDPSAERIALLIFERLRDRLPGAGLYRVDVFESDTSMARYEPA